MVSKILFQRLWEMVEKDEPAALVTVLEAKGSAPGKAGFKMLVDKKGESLGTVGGGLIEARIIQEAREALENNYSSIKTYTLDTEEAGGIGMLCGGEITVFIDVVVSPETLIIAGAGHVAQSLAAVASLLGYSITVIDDREDFCNKVRFPQAESCLVGDIGETLGEVNMNQNTYLTIVTRGHAYDEIALEKALQKEAGYIGMIGSKKKIESIYHNLRQKGFSEKKLREVHAPIGLDIGAETAEEIAISIMAEIISKKNNR